jgi:hypothetical protein
MVQKAYSRLRLGFGLYIESIFRVAGGVNILWLSEFKQRQSRCLNVVSLRTTDRKLKLSNAEGVA